MSQFGWGLIARVTEEDFVPAYRWDKEGSSYYSLRPDRWFPGVVQAYRLTTYSGFLEFQSRFRVAELSRGGGGPSVQSQTPLTSSKPSPQARASAQGGKAGVPARASQRGSRSGRKSCPKGQYWSFKQKKCVKSKFR